jgi:Flp pilus assembly CpaE family ATPase
MGTNGHNSNLRVLLSGPDAGTLEPSLADQPALSLIDKEAKNGSFLASSVDVALHVLGPAGHENVARDVHELRKLADVPLILAAYGEPNGIIETGLEVGAADVLVLPQPAETLLFALRKAARAGARRDAGTVITVFSPKGGSGKTVVATNLAAAAASSGLRTLLIDLDLQFGDVALTLAVAPRATIADLASSAGRVDVEKLNAFVSTEHRTGLDLLASPKRPEEAEAVGQTELVGVLDAARSAYDAIIVDTGPLFDRALLAALDHSDRLLMVCNPEVTSLKNVRIGLETIDRLGFPRERMSLVANRMGATGGVDRGDVERALDVEIAYELPDDPAVPAAVNRALPAVIGSERSKFARAIAELAADVLGAAPQAPAKAPERKSLLRGRR